VKSEYILGLPTELISLGAPLVGEFQPAIDNPLPPDRIEVGRGPEQSILANGSAQAR
jgi:hypothetical protein